MAKSKAVLKKWGKDLVCLIPDSLAQECGFTDRSHVEIRACDGNIVISKINSFPVYSLKELVSKITPDNKHNYVDTDFGHPVGMELL